jgi:hypothetical protein
MDPAILLLLIGSGLTLLATLLTTVVNAKLSESKEVRTETRKNQQQRVAKLETTYEEVLQYLQHVSLISYTGAPTAKTLLDSDTLEKSFAFHSVRLQIVSTPEIVNQYKRASNSILQMRRRLRDLPQVERAYDDQRLQEETAIFRPAWLEIDKLTNLMKAHLDSLWSKSE